MNLRHFLFAIMVMHYINAFLNFGLDKPFMIALILV